LRVLAKWGSAHTNVIRTTRTLQCDAVDSAQPHSRMDGRDMAPDGLFEWIYLMRICGNFEAARRVRVMPSLVVFPQADRLADR
jgi:hypothetical protein